VLALDNAERNREPEARAAGLAAAVGFDAMKGREHRSAVRNPRPIVVDDDLDHAAVALHPHPRPTERLEA